jgi:hypothetical protein
VGQAIFIKANLPGQCDGSRDAPGGCVFHPYACEFDCLGGKVYDLLVTMGVFVVIVTGGFVGRAAGRLPVTVIHIGMLDSVFSRLPIMRLGFLVGLFEFVAVFFMSLMLMTHTGFALKNSCLLMVVSIATCRQRPRCQEGYHH